MDLGDGAPSLIPSFRCFHFAAPVDGPGSDLFFTSTASVDLQDAKKNIPDLEQYHNKSSSLSSFFPPLPPLLIYADLN